MTKFIIFIIVAAYTLRLPVIAQTESEKIDQVLKGYEQANRFSGSVLVYKKGNTILNKGYGWRNAEQKIRNNENSIYQIYSITKSFTSTLILKLVQDGKLSLDDKLSKFYPEIPNAEKISIRHLLSHTSGLKEYTHTNDIRDGNEQSFIAFAKKYPLDFEPGSSWSYSNTGYWFLGFIISKLTGMSYEKAMAEYVFSPLSMKQSGFDFKTLNSPNKTTGYQHYFSAAKTPAVVYDPPGPYAAGAICSSTGDLLKFHQALQNYKLVKKEIQDLAYKPVLNNYGLGWMTDNYENRKTEKHSGGAAGYRSWLIRIPEDDVCVVILSNTENNIDRLSSQILDILYGKPYKVPQHLDLPTEALKKYEGTYHIPDRIFLHVEAHDGMLTVYPQGQPATDLYTESENRFFVEEINGYVSFRDDTLVLEQNGRTALCARTQASWGIVGSATRNSWEGPDIPLTKDGKSQKWIAKNIQLNDGELKFRFYNDWTLNYGINETGSLQPNGSNIPVKAGIYDIILDLEDKTKPGFSISPSNQK